MAAAAGINAAVEDTGVADSSYRKTESDLGLRIVSERMPWVRSVGVGIWVMTGSVYENDEESGISHMLEHMVFKGTERRSGLEIARAIEGVGGHINAFTSKELTCFYAQVLDDHLDLALDVLCDLLVAPRLAPDDIEREKLVIGEEIRHYEDTPHELIFDYFARTLFGDHPMARTILGTAQTVRKMTRESLFDYLRSHYTCNRIVIAAAGNLDHRRLVQGVEKRLKALPRTSNDNLPPLAYPEPRSETVKRSVQGAHLCRGVPGVRYADERKIAALLLSNLLGGGMSSRLFQRVREKEALAYNVYSYMDTMRDTGVFGIYVGTDPARLDRVIDVLNEEYDLILRNGIPEDELTRVKEQLKGNFMLGLENTSGRMFRLAKMEIYLNRFLTLDDTLALIDRVNLDEITKLAKQFLSIDRQYSAIILPKEENG